jgi:putative heme-binding domain-containing protein
LVKGVVEGGGRAAGYFTGSTGVTIYRGNAWPEEFHGLAIVGDVGSNIIHRKELDWTNLQPVAKRVDENREFVASTDIWFRPVQFANAPDGTLHILDMYREVIEHPASLPPEIKKHLDLTSGRDQGRLYRVLPDGFQQPKLPKLSAATVAELVVLLDHPNSWQRETASRLLYERHDKTAIPYLEQLAKSAKTPQGKMHVLYALAGLNALEERQILVALNDEHPQVRRHGIRLSELGTMKAPAVQKRLLELVNDPQVEVRYQLAFTLGDVRAPESAHALAALMKRDSGNEWMEWAVLSSVSENAGEVFSLLAADKEFAQETKGQAFLQELATLIGRSGKQDDVAHVLRSIEKLSALSQSRATSIVQSLVAGLSKSQSKLKGTISSDTKAGELIGSLIEKSRKLAGDAKAPIKDRAEAIRTLALSDFPTEKEHLVSLLDYQQPKAVQSAVVAALGQFNDPEVAQILLAPWSRYSPDLRGEALGVLLTRPAWTLSLLDAATKGTIPQSHLSLAQLNLLAESRDQTIQAIARKLLESRNVGGRKEVVQSYQKALELAGDLTKGRQIFQKNCSQCHRLENEGREIGPNLAAMKNRGAEAILLNVLDPNRELNPEFTEYIVATTQGQVFSGLIASETATSITLKQAENKPDLVVLRVDIEELKNSGRSLMPEGMEKTIDPQAMADLIAYLTSLRSP